MGVLWSVRARCWFGSLPETYRLSFLCAILGVYSVRAAHETVLGLNMLRALLRNRDRIFWTGSRLRSAVPVTGALSPRSSLQMVLGLSSCPFLAKELAGFVLLALLTLSGCYEFTGPQLARARAAREYECPEKKVRVKWLSDGPKDYTIYKVAACGTIATYACDVPAQACVKESDDHR